jgi:hypothetical protein
MLHTFRTKTSGVNDFEGTRSRASLVMHERVCGSPTQELFQRREDGCQAFASSRQAHFGYADVGHEKMNIVRRCSATLSASTP